ncbi:hypothetical protein PC118_g3674 [Phytophthora cactorum]|uniref:Uncharacterized protein n=1 Tax=Phytophthora cactorum TaxID=29920 RepID=A0A8T0ZR48_9STRA|nr:hypothetical protein PC112_g4371 [Phytophthora cactorum]KAG2840776.1 hypothetical protein PC111_g3358 [Phytophthora cactorum]KAG2864794.1 hypothetical protein PC113_g4263 [Phytophthora cactorum]KAG2994104.1 hypothetical protein PC118_g3674 [Phytophthora cactorum]KAG3036846.1 hypothetical protein PC119_g4111 [Phytophthora cactorum]
MDKSSEVARVTLGKLSKSIKAVMSESNKMDSQCRARDYGSPRCVIVNHSECIKCRFREEHLKAMPPGGTTRRMVQGLTRGVGKSLQAMRKEERFVGGQDSNYNENVLLKSTSVSSSENNPKVAASSRQDAPRAAPVGATISSRQRRQAVLFRRCRRPQFQG